MFESSAIQHFHDKLLHIKERLKTEPGKKLAEKRHKLVSGLFVAYIKFPDCLPDGRLFARGRGRIRSAGMRPCTRNNLLCDVTPVP